MNQSCWARSVVNVLIPFITQRALRHRVSGAGGKARYSGIAPEGPLAVIGRNLQLQAAIIIRARSVDHEQRTGEGIFRQPAVGRRTEACVPPKPGPMRVLAG